MGSARGGAKRRRVPVGSDGEVESGAGLVTSRGQPRVAIAAEAYSRSPAASRAALRGRFQLSAFGLASENVAVEQVRLGAAGHEPMRPGPLGDDIGVTRFPRGRNGPYPPLERVVAVAAADLVDRPAGRQIVSPAAQADDRLRTAACRRASRCPIRTHDGRSEAAAGTRRLASGLDVRRPAVCAPSAITPAAATPITIANRLPISCFFFVSALISGLLRVVASDLPTSRGSGACLTARSLRHGGTLSVQRAGLGVV